MAGTAPPSPSVNLQSTRNERGQYTPPCDGRKGLRLNSRVSGNKHISEQEICNNQKGGCLAGGRGRGGLLRCLTWVVGHHSLLLSITLSEHVHFKDTCKIISQWKQLPAESGFLKGRVPSSDRGASGQRDDSPAHWPTGVACCPPRAHTRASPSPGASQSFLPTFSHTPAIKLPSPLFKGKPLCMFYNFSLNSEFNISF